MAGMFKSIHNPFMERFALTSGARTNLPAGFATRRNVTAARGTELGPDGVRRRRKPVLMDADEGTLG